MSLQLAAQHLQAHGRGDDNHLVHMTSGELESLQKLAQAGGGSLTLNPHTGLPEAGFLSSLLPTIAGVALGAITGNPMLAAMLVGGADTAITGSLGQGLMAGLGAWGGSSFGGDIASFGTAGVDSTTSLAPIADTASNIAPQASNALVSTNVAPDMLGNMANAPISTTGGGMTTSEGLGQNVANGVQNSMPYNAPLSSTAATATQTPTSIDPYVKGTDGGYSGAQLWQGAKNAFSTPMDFLKQPGVGMDALKAFGSPALAGLQALNQQSAPPTEPKDTNPMHLKVNPQWSGPTQPSQPNPYYKADYRNYVQSPYTATAADGGLMDVSHYDYGGETDLTPQQKYNAMHDINAGAAMMSIQPADMPSSHLSYHAGAHDPGIYHTTNAEYAASTPQAMMQLYKIKQASGLAPVMALGSYSTDPAMVAQQEIEKQPAAQSAKEGGLQRFAGGGVASYAAGSYLVPNSGNYTTPTATPAPGGKGMPGGKGYTNPSMDNLTSQSQMPGGKGQAIGVMPGGKGNAQSNAAYASSPLGSAWLNMMGQSNSPAQPYSSQNLSPDFGAKPPAPAENTNVYVPHYANGGDINLNMGGIGSLGSYSDGGRLLKGPGDGVSDSIPASIGGKQPARLAEGEFVIPARIVSEIGNGSTDAGAKRLYAMMDRVKAKRASTKNIAADTKAYRYLPS